MVFNKEALHTTQGARLLSALKVQGLRLTAPRRAIVECLGASQDWLTAAAIYEQARVVCPSLGLVTVYRTLNWLHQQGLVRRVHRSDGCHGYALAGLPHGHYLVCQKCQQVVEFSSCDLTILEARIAGETGFTIQGHMLQFVGTCPACQTDACG